MGYELNVAIDVFPIAGRFVIARGAKTQARVVTVTLTQGAHRGRGECVPYARYGESVEGVVAAIEGLRAALAQGADRAALQGLLPPGAARNALDCAFFDLEAKRAGQPVVEIAEFKALRPLVTALTISVGSPDEMFAAAETAAAWPLLKVKLAGDGDAERLAAVRAGAPQARFIVDANEAWREADLEENFALCAKIGVDLIEQPLPAGADGLLARIARPVPVCADESAHARDDLEALCDRYDAVNIKLDKTGGLTEALAMVKEARNLGLKIMAGCMVGSSLAMAPAMLIGQSADWVDLDGPLLLASDREPGLVYEGFRVFPPAPELWG
ncbi:MAG: N-acetyl-D-Glu racemase DgcA [Methylocystis sp.]